MHEPKPPIYGEPIAGRSSQVRQILENYRQTLSTINFDAAELLVESQDQNYFREWGTTLGQFVEDNLDMSEREAMYLMRITRVSRQVGYKREDIESIAVSKLKAIFSLDPDGVFYNPETQENEKLDGHIRRLVELAPSTGLDAIRAEVKRLKGQVGENEMTWTNFQTTRLTKENVIMPGLESFRRYLGSKGVVEKEGSTEYSDGFVLEMIMAEILSGAPTPEEEIHDEILEEEPV